MSLPALSTPAPVRRAIPPRIVSILLACALGTPSFAANITGFLPAEGEGALAFGVTEERYDEFWRGDEKRSTPAALGEISTRSQSVWLNWGLTSRLALIVDMAHVDADADGFSALEDSGLQDASVLLAARLWSRSTGAVEHSLVGAFGLRTPLDSYEANAPVARGDDTTDDLFRLVYLRRAGSFYWSQQVGFDLRSGDAPDGFPIYTEIGYSAGRWTWIGFYSMYLADGGTDIGDSGFTFPSNREEFERVGAKALIGLGSDWSLFAGGFTTLDGRNVGNADGLFFGTVVNF